MVSNKVGSKSTYPTILIHSLASVSLIVFQLRLIPRFPKRVFDILHAYRYAGNNLLALFFSVFLIVSMSSYRFCDATR